MIENLNINDLDIKTKQKHIEKRIERIQQQYFDEMITKKNQEKVVKSYKNANTDIEKAAKAETEQALSVTNEKIAMMITTFDSLLCKRNTPLAYVASGEALLSDYLGCQE